MRRHRKLLRMGSDCRTTYLLSSDIFDSLFGSPHLYSLVDSRSHEEVSQLTEKPFKSIAQYELPITT